VGGGAENAGMRILAVWPVGEFLSKCSLLDYREIVRARFVPHHGVAR
jgi:hypothetical protein